MRQERFTRESRAALARLIIAALSDEYDPRPRTRKGIYLKCVGKPGNDPLAFDRIFASMVRKGEIVRAASRPGYTTTYRLASAPKAPPRLTSEQLTGSQTGEVMIASNNIRVAERERLLSLHNPPAYAVLNPKFVEEWRLRHPGENPPGWAIPDSARVAHWFALGSPLCTAQYLWSGVTDPTDTYWKKCKACTAKRDEYKD